MRPERGFINRKVARLASEQKRREDDIQSLDLCLENLLARAMKLAKKRKHARKQLERVTENITRLQPRLKCENKSLAFAPCRIEIPEGWLKDLKDMF